ncbi:hypothetical protein LCGC14_2635790 [marine sediment metagenome]|uniref:DUF4145 domain-containing protein n=1 Tax=marine sediment metagenome TaxID=412755 RepID=A0A0F8ZZ72_9ZZZZ
MVSDGLRAHFEGTLEQRVNRCLEVSHQDVIPNHYFAAASAECIDLYTDGYFLSAVMVTHAVAEGIRRFVVECERIKLDDNMKGPDIFDLLVQKGIISKDCADAFNQIWGSFRNAVHHMYATVEKIPFPTVAKSNIQALAVIEREVFAFKSGKNGGLIPTNPKYWDVRADGMISAFLRFSR